MDASITSADAAKTVYHIPPAPTKTSRRGQSIRLLVMNSFLVIEKAEKEKRNMKRPKG